MFSLLITIISIALVAVLALATLYYGGDAFNKGNAEAQAAKLLNQGQQLLGAAELYYIENQAWPSSVAELVSGNYLKSVPVALQEGQAAVSLANAGVSWEMPVPGIPVFQVSIADTNTCSQFNKRGSLASSSTPENADVDLTAQCYGSAAEYTVVMQKRAGQLQAVLDASAGWLNTYPTVFSGGGFYPVFRAAQGAGPAEVTFSQDVDVPGLTFFAAWLADESGTSVSACGSAGAGGKTWTCTTTEALPNVVVGVGWNGDGGGGQHTDIRATSGTASVAFHLMTVTF